MKKTIILTVLINLMITGTALALVQIKQFSDVEKGSFYSTAVDNMVYQGVVKGYDDGLFHPNDGVNRAQAVTMLDRYDQNLKDTEIKYLKTMVCTGFNENTGSYPDYKAAYQKLCMPLVAN
ncbi:MAG: S-layer homology domain-containing protein [Candidatus Gracilibacteria bacterium]